MANSKLTPEKQHAFLVALAETCSVTKACGAVGMSREQVYKWRRDDKIFKANWEIALSIGADALEDEAVRRASDGVAEPVFYKGEQVDTITKYSDTLLIFLLKGAKPEKYADRNKTELTGANGGPIELSNLQLAEALNALQSNRPLPDFSNTIEHQPSAIVDAVIEEEFDDLV